MKNDVKNSVRNFKTITAETINTRYFQSTELTSGHQQIDVSVCGISLTDVSNLSNCSVCDIHRLQ
jgi:hypothetical protein